MSGADAGSFDVTVRMAALLLRSSAEGVEMLERYLPRIADAFRLDLDLLVLPEQVLLTDRSSRTATPVAVVRATPGLSRLDQVMDLKVLTLDIERGLSPADAAQRLDELADAPPHWPAWLRVIGVVLFATGFAPSVVATGTEVVAAALLGAVMGLFLIAFEGRRFEPLLPFVAALALTVIAATLLDGLVDAAGVALVVVPALFVVVPGDYLSAAAGELIGGYISVGATRLVYATLLLALLVTGMAAGSELTGGTDTLVEHAVEPTLPYIVIVLAWIPFAVGLILAFNGRPGMLLWLIPTVIGTYLLQQLATRAVGDITGTLVAGIALGAVANLLSAPSNRPPRLLMMLGGFFVLTVGGLGLRGATALIGGDVVSGFDNLLDFFVQVPTVAIALAVGVLATAGRRSRNRLG